MAKSKSESGTSKSKSRTAAKATLQSDDLSLALANKLNNSFKDVQIAFILSEEDSPTDLDDFVSTGSTILDIAATDRIDGGFPVGRISEITGLEGTGKSLMAMHALANTQRRGGIAVLIDTENAVDESFLTTIGVDISKLIYCPVDAIEDAFAIIEKLITDIRAHDVGEEKRLVTIVLDSVAAATTKVEQESDFEKDGYATTKAIVMSKSLRKITNMIGRERVCLIFTNQLREKLNSVPFGDKWTTPGGKALPFHASLRLRITSTGQLKQTVNKISHVIGIQTDVAVKKTRMAPPHRKVSFPIYFDSGIDDINSWLDHLVKYSVIKKVGGSYSYKESKFTGNEWRSLIQQSEEFRSEILQELRKTLVLNEKVTSENVNKDSISVDADEE